MNKLFMLPVIGALILGGCSQTDIGVNTSNENDMSASVIGGYYDILVCKNDRSMWRLYGSKSTIETGSFQSVQGVAKGVSIGWMWGFVYDVQNPTAFSSGQTWHIGGDNNYNGHLWRVETRVGSGPGWIRHSIVINGETILATDIGAKKDWRYNNDKVMAIGATSVNGSNIFAFNQSTATWSVFGGAAVKIDIDEQMNPWCVNSQGNIYQHNGSSWVIKNSGLFAATEIGCGAQAGGIYAVTNSGALKRYTGSAWVDVPEFTATGKAAKKIDASGVTVLISTTSNELYMITPSPFSSNTHYFSGISNVDDVSFSVDYSVGS